MSLRGGGDSFCKGGKKYSHDLQTQTVTRLTAINGWSVGKVPKVIPVWEVSIGGPFFADF